MKPLGDSGVHRETFGPLSFGMTICSGSSLRTFRAGCDSFGSVTNRLPKKPSGATITRMKVMKREPAIGAVRILLSAAVRVLICVVFVLGFYASAQQSSSASIVGRWRSLETTKGGIGQIWEFRSDGTFDFSMGAVVNMPWRIENNQLVLPPDTNDGPEVKANLKWLGDDKLRLETEWSSTELKRVGDRPDPDHPMLGEWIENREMGGLNFEAHYLFYARGEVLLVMPFKIEHGSYTISGSMLHLKQGDQTSESNFKLADNFLSISAPKGGEDFRYARY